jgi:hypothetical protein
LRLQGGDSVFPRFTAVIFVRLGDEYNRAAVLVESGADAFSRNPGLDVSLDGPRQDRLPKRRGARLISRHQNTKRKQGAAGT